MVMDPLNRNVIRQFNAIINLEFLNCEYTTGLTRNRVFRLVGDDLKVIIVVAVYIVQADCSD